MRVVVSQFEGIDATPALPLAAGCLVAAAREDDHIAAHTEFAIAFRRLAVDEVVRDFKAPDVLGFSLYPWNAAYSLAIAAAARREYPDCLIIAGGPSVPRRPGRAQRLLDDHGALDMLVFSEGELTFREVLRARLSGTGFGHIGGIAMRGDDGHTFTDAPVRVHEFSATASPFLDGTFDELCATHRDRFSMALLETNRGCPFSCTFCDWSLTKHVVEFPVERVHAELDWVAKHGFHHIMMADANFGIRPRDLDIAHYVADLHKRTGTPSSFYYYLTKNDHARNLETIDVLQAADIGCWVGLAVQDFDDQVLDAVKRDNIQTGESMKLRDICGERNIPTFNELILGLPGQTYDSFTATIIEAMPALPRHDFVLFLCRMIDNTELGDPESRERFGIQTRHCQWKTSTANFDPVIDEFQEVVVATNDLPLADWQRAFRFSFFAAALYNLRLLRVVLHHATDVGIDLRDYVSHLSARLTGAPSDSVYGRMGAAIDSYIASVLSGGPFVLPTNDGPAVYVDEAVAAVALTDYDDFLAETEALTREFLASSRTDTMAEAFRYQAMITPRWRSTEPTIVDFDHDWPTYVAGGGRALDQRRTSLRYVPPTYAGMDKFTSFLTTHVGCTRVRLDAGVVEAYAPNRLVVLPASANRPAQ